MNIRTYTISQACKDLNVTQNKLRYIEEKIGYDVQRDNFGNRQYSEADIMNIKEFIRMHSEQKMSYEAIKLNHYDLVKEIDFTYDNASSEASTRSTDNTIDSNDKETAVTPIAKDIVMKEYMEKMQNTFGAILDRLESVDQMQEKLDKLNKLDELESKMDKIQESMDKQVSVIQERIAEEIRVSQVSQDLKSLLDTKKKKAEEKNKGFFSWFKK